MGGEPPRLHNSPSLDLPSSAFSSPSSSRLHVIIPINDSPALALAAAMARRLKRESITPKIIVAYADAMEEFPAGSPVTIIDYDALNYALDYFDETGMSTRYFIDVHGIVIDPTAPLAYDGRARVPVRLYGSVVEAARALMVLPSRDSLTETLALAAAVAARDRLALRYTGYSFLANLPMVYYFGIAEALRSSARLAAAVIEDSIDDPSRIELSGYKVAEQLAGWARCVAEAGVVARRGSVLLVDMEKIREAGCHSVDAAATLPRPSIAALEVFMLREGAQAAAFIYPRDASYDHRIIVGFIANWLSPIEPPRPEASPLGLSAEIRDPLLFVTPGIYAEAKVESDEEARRLWTTTADWLADHYVQPWRLRYDETVFAQLER